MLALWHLFAGVPAGQLPGLETVTKMAGVSQPPKVRRAVLVGNRLSPADVHTKPDGTVVRTLWGELAWQLGGKEGYAMVRSADEKAVSPGDSLRLLFNKYSPCLILIDEWVAYRRTRRRDRQDRGYSGPSAEGTGSSPVPRIGQDRCHTPLA
jgi:predicted AAA+ superfamily ATPase